MRLVKLLLICLIAAGLFCSGCKKDESTPSDPNAQVTSSQDKVLT
jgi:outer membrane lipoprotein-sorting protein